MKEFDFEEAQEFWNVGMLKTLLTPYSNDTPIAICGMPGMFLPDEEQHCILLEALECECYYASDAATDREGYLDF